MSTLALSLLKLGSVLCAACALGALLIALGRMRDTLLTRLYHRYVASLERKMRLMFIELRGVHVVFGQLLAVVLALAASLWLSMPLLLLLVPAALAGPTMVLEHKRKQRLQQIEAKLDTFVVALANAMRASPSPGRALAMILPVTPAPLDREIELTLREMRVGSTLEQALGNLSARVRSFQLDAALSGLLIGRQTGGNVPLILDGAAETLREMARLHGVLRAKTAEGRAQVKVLAGFPAVLLVAFDYTSPGYFLPLTSCATGWIITFLALGLWLGSVLMTRQIMEVEL